MNPFDAKKKIETDPDFIALKRFDHSLEKLLERYPDGCPDRVIANALMMTEAEVEELYQKAVARIRVIMNIND